MEKKMILKLIFVEKSKMMYREKKNVVCVSRFSFYLALFKVGICSVKPGL